MRMMIDNKKKKKDGIIWFNPITPRMNGVPFPYCVITSLNTIYLIPVNRVY